MKMEILSQPVRSVQSVEEQADAHCNTFALYEEAGISDDTA
ncbi:hypothetical protein ACFQ88_21200 [Paenibacillus sp. NPDC056579]